MPLHRWAGVTLADLLLAGLLLALAASVSVTAQSGRDDRDGDGLRDGFEEHWGQTSPDSADSDGDGLIDAAEDDDGDQLSALGEQRYGTDPGRADSDGDGIGDGDEDSDGDGLSDSREQDRRPAPRDLRPAPKAAWWDRPANYDDRCHSDQFDAVLHTCEFGDVDSDTTVVLFGDSHALQWLPALAAAADAEGWRVVTLTKAACPPAQILSGRKDPSAGASCERWRPKAIGWIAENKPDVALLGGAGRLYRLVDARGDHIPDADRTARWQQGLEQTLAALPEATTVVVLADTPLLTRNPASCLEEDASDLSACSTTRAAAIDHSFDRAERMTTEAAGGRYEDLTALVCPYSPCPIVMGDVLAYRNRDHITATFSEQLAPSMREVVLRALGGTGVAPTPAPPGAEATGG